MRILSSNSSPEQIRARTTSRITVEIIARALREADLLPSIRTLAHDLLVSAAATKRAREELEGEGFLDSVGGKGTPVAAQTPAFPREQRMKLVEDRLAAAVVEARRFGIGRDELTEMLQWFHGEDR